MIKQGWYTPWSFSVDDQGQYYMDTVMSPEESSGGTAVVYVSSKGKVYINPSVAKDDVEEYSGWPEGRYVEIEVLESEKMPSLVVPYNRDLANEVARRIEESA